MKVWLEFARGLTWKLTTSNAWNSLNNYDQEQIGNEVGVTNMSDFEFLSDVDQQKLIAFMKEHGTDSGDVGAMNRWLRRDQPPFPSGPIKLR